VVNYVRERKTKLNQGVKRKKIMILQSNIRIINNMKQNNKVNGAGNIGLNTHSKSYADRFRTTEFYLQMGFMLICQSYIFCPFTDKILNSFME
jgi:hypothetical protein